MRWAIISDIHSNLEALSSVLEEIDRVAVDRIICLGDIVGYGASPNECVGIIRERNIESIVGNHDVVACSKKEPYDFNPVARGAALWTRNSLADENRSFLYELPATKDFGDFFIIHGGISDPDLYILSPYDALEEFRLMEKEKRTLCFFGHTHVMTYFRLSDSALYQLFDYEFKIDPRVRYLINPGSVGQPRDNNPKASFLIYDSEEGRVRFIRVGYDVSTSQKKILGAGLDPRLAKRLSVGV